MLPDQLLLILIVATTTLLFITRWVPIEVTSVGAVATLVLTGLLPPQDALSGFSSTAMLTVAAMFVLSGGLLRTGALEAVTLFLAHMSRGSRWRLLLSIGIIAAVASAFVNNTPVVVMLVPVLLSLGQQLKIRPSKLLIPLSYFCILGGTMTLLGTSTNILLDDLYRRAGGPGFRLFEFAPLGIIFTLIGIAYMLLFSQRLLPDRSPLLDLVSQRRKTAFITELVVGADSSAIDRAASNVFSRISSVDRGRVAGTQRRHRRISRPRKALQAEEEEQDSLELLQVIRQQRIYRAEETEELTLQAADILVVAGTPNEIARFVESTETHLVPVLADGDRVPVSDVRSKVIEAVILPDSPHNGQLVGDLEFNKAHGVKIMGLQHHGRQRVIGIRDARLRAGDVLLLQAPPDALHAVSERGKLLLVEGVDQGIMRTTKNRIALLIMLAVVSLAALTDVPIVALALAGAGLMVVTKCLRTDEALRSLDAATLFLLAGTIPMGIAMQTTGLAQDIVDFLLSFLGAASPIVFLSVFYLMTNLLTQILSNNAVAVLLMPIALNLSVSLGVNATPLLMAVAFGASASFLTPMGYQTNAIVMGPGGYTFGDYLRIGIPLTILMWLTATIFIPIFWPL